MEGKIQPNEILTSENQKLEKLL